MSSPSVASAVKATLAALRKEANPERKRFMEGYAPSGERFLGVAVPALRKEAKRVARELKGSDPQDVVAMAQGFVEAGWAEMRQVGYEILEHEKQALATLGAKDLERLGRGMDNWAAVDAFSCGVAGRVWLRGGIADATVKRWARSKDRWWRRAALASTVPLNMASRGGTGDVKRTLTVCRLLAGDHDEMVVKALSWALRSCVPHDAAAVREFLLLHEGDLARRVVREVSRKLETGRK